MPTARSTYVYLIIVLGLLAYILIFDKKIQGTKEREAAQTRLYDGFQQDQVTGLEITNDHGTFIFQKNNGHWEIKSPITTVADDGVLDEVLDAISNAQVQRNIPISSSDPDTIANLKEWGLTPPADRVVIHMTDKTTYELTLGRKTAINESVYARSSQQSGEPVRIVNLALKSAFEKDLSDFRSRNIFDFSTENVTQIDATTSSTSTTAAQSNEVVFKDNKWHLQKPIVARATSDSVNNLLQKFLGLRVVDFITDNASNLSSYGLSTPASTLSVTTKPKGEELLLQIGSPVTGKTDQVYAQRLGSNSVFTVQKASLDDVFHAIPNTRDLHILPFTPSQVTNLSFSFQDKKGEVKSHDSLWSTVGQAPGDADISKVLDLINKLGGLQTTPLLKDSAPDLEAYGLDEPQGKIVITSSEYPAPLELSIGKHQNKLYFVRNSLEPFIYTIQDTDLDFLPKSNLELRDARALNLSADKLKSIEITPEDHPKITLSRAADQSWSVTTPANRKVDSTKLDKFNAVFSQLQAKTWLGSPLPSYKLDKPQLTITAKTDTATVTLLIGNTLPDTTHAAQIVGQDTAFSITDADYTTLTTSTLLPESSTPPAK